MQQSYIAINELYNTCDVIYKFHFLIDIYYFYKY